MHKMPIPKGRTCDPKRRHCASRLIPDLQGTSDALGIVRRDACRHGGVDAAQSIMECCPSERYPFFVKSRAQLGICGWQGIEALSERLEIKHGATDQEGHAFTCPNVIDGTVCIL